MPGEENADFMLSLEDSALTFVMTRHEQGAAFMAEVNGRLTGNPAPCLGTLGPGATNLITGVPDANVARAPLLVRTGQAATTRQHKESHRVMDVAGMYEPVTKRAHAIAHPGPSLIALPIDYRKSMALSERLGALEISM